MKNSHHYQFDFEVQLIIMKIFAIEILFLLFLAVLNEFCFGAEISTAHGPVRGRTRTTETGRIYWSFQGIPYARPPEGPLRFRVRISREN